MAITKLFTTPQEFISPPTTPKKENIPPTEIHHLMALSNGRSEF